MESMPAAQKMLMNMRAEKQRATVIHHKPNYGSESDTDQNTDDSPGIEISESWKTGLFDCHRDYTIAAATTFSPCVTFGHIAEVLDEGETTWTRGSCIYVSLVPGLCSQWIMGSKYRAKLRRKFNFVEAPREDCASHWFCPCCSLCQEYRELKIRGLDPYLGWKGILARQQGIQQSPQDPLQWPPQNQAMSK